MRREEKMRRQRRTANKPHWRKRPERRTRPQPQIEEPLFQVRYDERPIERYAECMEMDIFNAGRDGATEYVHGKLASRIGLKLADEGFIKFETNENPARRGITIRASVNVVKP